jgi:hypothetical protein
MLSLELEISSHTAEDNIDGLSRGHMTITGSQGFATSKARQPDQSMMIFLSVVELLDGVRRFILGNNASHYNFVGVDSSFQLFLTKELNDNIKLRCDQKPIDIVRTDEMIRAVWEGINRFLALYRQYIDSGDPVANDLQASIESFKTSFNIHN